MKRIFPILILLSLLSCTDRHTRFLLDDVAAYIAVRPDSALTVLNSIDSDDLAGRRTKAQYALLYSMALDKNVIDVTSDSLISVATEWYSRHGSPDDRLKAFYYHGRVCQNAGDNERAMEHFVRAEAYAEEAEDNYAKGLLYNAMGGIYLDVLDIRMANEAFLSAKQCYKKADNTDKYADALLNIIGYHIECHSFDEAVAELDEVKMLWDDVSSRSRGGYYRRLIYLNRSMADSTELCENLHEYLDVIEPEFIDWLDVSEAFCYIKDYKSSLAALEKFKEVDESYEINPVYHLCAYELYDSLGWTEDALDAYRSYTDIINRTTTGIVTQDTPYISEKYKSEMMIMRKRNAILMIVVCSLVCFILLLAVIWWITGRLRHQEEANRRYLEECSLLESERDSLAGLIEGNRLVEEEAQKVIEARLELLNRFFSSAIQENHKKNMEVSDELEALMENKDKFLHDTRMIFAGTYPGFIDFLKDKGLDEHQIEICCLYALGLSGKDVINYIRRKRHYIDNMEIRVKLGLTEHDHNLGKYILNLFSMTK